MESDDGASLRGKKTSNFQHNHRYISQSELADKDLTMAGENSWLEIFGCKIITGSDDDSDVFEPIEIDLSRDHTEVFIQRDNPKVPVVMQGDPSEMNVLSPPDPSELHVVTQDDPPEGIEVTQSNPSEVNEPARELTVNTQFECSVCRKTYTRKSSLMRHKQSHTKKGEPCSTCGKVYFSKSELNSHTLTHRTKLSCRFCDKHFVTKLGRKRHEDSVHKKKFSCFCEICGKGYNYKSELSDHVTTHNKDAACSCPKCNKKLKCQTGLRRHLSTCGAAKKYKCNVCGKLFKAKRYESEHRRTHEDQHLFQCSVCGEAYTHHSSLYRHKKKKGH